MSHQYTQKKPQIAGIPSHLLLQHVVHGCDGRIKATPVRLVSACLALVPQWRAHGRTCVQQHHRGFLNVTRYRRAAY